MAEREDSLFLATEEVATLPSVETLVEPQNSDATRVALPNKIRNLIALSLVAAAPFLASCGDAGEDETSLKPDRISASENVDDWQKREVHLWYDYSDWHFEGKFPRDFMLSVYVDGKLAFNEQVNVENGSFDVSGPAGETTKNIDIMAYEVQPQGAKFFVSIPIEPKITSKGMVGVSHMHGIDKM